MSQTLTSYSIQNELQLRFLAPSDIPEVKRLCSDWFPIDYPDSWYEDITSHPKFYSLAATYNAQIVGLVVCEVKTRSRCNREDADILAPNFPPSTQMAYILSLGVVSNFRRQGIASLLLDSLLQYVTSSERKECKAVYLHVLSSNTTAIRFYERRNFYQHSFLPYYYSIQGSPQDGYSYVLYINGGQPPWTLLDYMKQFGSVLLRLQSCALPKRLFGSIQGIWRRLVVASMASLQPLSQASSSAAQLS